VCSKDVSKGFKGVNGTRVFGKKRRMNNKEEEKGGKQKVA